MADVSPHSLPALNFAYSTAAGAGRSVNQDFNLGSKKKEFNLFMLADGMGPGEAGAEAAQRALRTIRSAIGRAPKISAKTITGAIRRANKKIIQFAEQEEEGTENIGATVCGLLVTPEKVFLFNVGNTRIYLFQQASYEQLSIDHTLEGQTRRGSGNKKPLQGGTRPESHLVTSSLGLAEELEIHVEELKSMPQAGWVYLLCSDGLYDVLHEEVLAKLIQEHIDDPRVLADQLIKRSVDEKTRDDVSAFVVRFDEPMGEGKSKEAPKTEIKRHSGTEKGSVSEKRSKRNERKAPSSDSTPLPVPSQVAAAVPVPVSNSDALIVESAKDSPSSKSSSSSAATSHSPRGYALLASRNEPSEKAQTGNLKADTSSNQKGDASASAARPFHASTGHTTYQSATPSGERSFFATDHRLRPSRLSTTQMALFGVAGLLLLLISVGVVFSFFRSDSEQVKMASVKKDVVEKKSSKTQKTPDVQSIRVIDESLSDSEEELHESTHTKLAFPVAEIAVRSSLGLDRIEDPKTRAFLIDIYTAIRQALRTGEGRLDKMSENAEDLSEGIDKLSNSLEELRMAEEAEEQSE